MYELIQTGEQSYYIDCPSKIGVYDSDGQNVFLIDSGNDKDAGKRAYRIIKDNNWRLWGILNTHSHADHIGGNRYLQNQTGCTVFAPGMESAFTRFPILEPSLLYGGYPCKDLRHKFLLAQESNALDFMNPNLQDPRFPHELEVIPLPGHCFDMVGYRTPDGTVFLADCISSAATLEKYAVSFIYDVGAYLDTLDRVEQLEASMFVPAHAEASQNVRPLVKLNRDKVHEIAGHILTLCKEPTSFEKILQGIFRRYHLVMTFEQHALVGSTIRSYLSWLKEQDAVTVIFDDNMLLWKCK